MIVPVGASQASAAEVPVTLVVRRLPGGADASERAVLSDRSIVRSELPRYCWWTSTAMVLVPATKTFVGTVKGNSWLSAAPSTFAVANVVLEIVPVGMLLRATSVPLM